MTSRPRRLGILLPHRSDPADIAAFAREVERLGFDDLWIPENCGFAGGVSGAAIALGATERIRVGIGILPVSMRHPFTTAMEFATLSRAFAGRFVAGLGLGVPGWLDDLGVNPDAPLRAVRDTVTVVDALLRGDTVTAEGELFSIAERALSPQVADRPPLYLGAVGPAMLKLAARRGDGVVFSVLSSPEFVRDASALIAATRHAAVAASADRCEVVCFTNFAVDPDGGAARASLRPDSEFLLNAMGPGPLTEAIGITAEVVDRVERQRRGEPTPELPEEWIAAMSVAGTPAECRERVDAYGAAGVDTLVLSPKPLARTRELLAQAAGLLGGAQAG